MSLIDSEKLKLLNQGKNTELDDIPDDNTEFSDQVNFLKEIDGIGIDLDDHLLPPCDYVTCSDVNNKCFGKNSLSFGHHPLVTILMNCVPF